MSRIVRFEQIARAEFAEAIAWYEEQRPGLGRQFESEISTVLNSICHAPEHFRRVSASVRKARLRRFPSYSIYFTQATDLIAVVAVWHASRNPAVLGQRLKT